MDNKFLNLITRLKQLLFPINKYINYDEKLGVTYCGFSARLNATLIDTIVLMILFYPFGVIMGYIGQSSTYYADDLIRLRASYPLYEDVPFSAIVSTLIENGFFFYLALNFLVTFTFTIIFYTFFYRKFSATPGKWLLGYKVVDADTLQPLSQKQTIKRILSYILAGLLFGLGFFAILFTKRSQGLHDIIANTVVIEGKHDFSAFERMLKYIKKQYKHFTKHCLKNIKQIN